MECDNLCQCLQVVSSEYVDYSEYYFDNTYAKFAEGSDLANYTDDSFIVSRRNIEVIKSSTLAQKRVYLKKYLNSHCLIQIHEDRFVFASRGSLRPLNMNNSEKALIVKLIKK